MIPRTWSWDPVALTVAGVAVALYVSAALLLWSHFERLERSLAT